MTSWLRRAATFVRHQKENQEEREKDPVHLVSIRVYFQGFFTPNQLFLVNLLLNPLLH